VRSAIVAGTIAGLVVLGVAAAVLDRAGWADVVLPHAHGPGAWQLTRATGFTAYVALALDMTLGLLVSARAGGRWLPRGHAADLHRWLSAVAIALVIGHAGVLLADGFVRFDTLDLLIPFIAPYRPIAVGLGIVAMYATLVVHGSFALRRRLGGRTWRRLHALSFVAFAAAAAHAIAAGTDAARAWAIAIVGAPAAAVIALVVVRARQAPAAGRAQASRAASAR
jgi:methionine sulfoxide reductase heme-binding subunit